MIASFLLPVYAHGAERQSPAVVTSGFRRVHALGGALRVAIGGDLDIASAPAVRERLLSLLRRSPAPQAEHKAYLHRSGRTVRAGAAGTVITRQAQAQAADVRALMRT
jgi:hypothetical protein